ncbi:hypothetical protein GCM10010216_71980 [Streptomyces flaveolus]|nr:hypothetical protein GCM10010216_71980 [Streptomyces flaveolus]
MPLQASGAFTSLRGAGNCATGHDGAAVARETRATPSMGAPAGGSRGPALPGAAAPTRAAPAARLPAAAGLAADAGGLHAPGARGTARPATNHLHEPRNLSHPLRR